MGSKEIEYHIAWVLSSYRQYFEARLQFVETHNSYSPDGHVTYTLGRVGVHNVVIANPASDHDDTTTVELIVNNLLLYFPSIRAGFVVSTDAYVPRGGPARIGDVAISMNPQHMNEGLVYVDAEASNREERLFMKRRSANVPVVIAAAAQELRSNQENIDNLLKNSKSAASQPRPQVFYGSIATSSGQIKDSIIKSAVTQGWRFCCFETAASTMKSRRLILLAGITHYCGKRGNYWTHRQVGRAAVSYLTRLLQYIDPRILSLEPPVVEYFEYESLDLERPAFRLLRLEGGTGQLQCHIFQAYLPSDKNKSDDEADNETMLIPYQALSYCWGSDKLTKAIRINGKILPITSNLFQALGYLRLADRDRILWIDAICIDQDNILERGHQVDMMGRLYSKAEEVLIWLGDIDDDTHRLISMLRSFEANVPLEARRKWGSEDTRYRTIWNHTQDAVFGEQASLQPNLECLTNNPWFTRVWIIQEVANAKRASLGCTDGWIDARTFAVVPNLLQITPNTGSQAIIDIIPGASRMSSWFSHKPNLLTLLWRFRESQARDPRDKLYALLGISSDKPVAADYSKAEPTIVREILDYVFQGESVLLDLRFSNINTIPALCSAGLEQLILRGANLDDLKQFETRYTTPLLLTTETVNYLRYVRSPLLVQLVHQDSLVLSQEVMPLAALLTRGGKIQVSTNILNASLQNGMGFVRMVLDLDRDDIEINHALAFEAISNGPRAVERFLAKYEDKSRIIEDSRGQAILKNLHLLKSSFRHAGNFHRHCGTLQQLLYQRRYRNSDNRKTTGIENISVAELQNTENADATLLQVLLRQPFHEIKVTDEVSLKAIRGTQEVITTFLAQEGYAGVFEHVAALEELISNYSVEVFLSSRGDHIEIMQVDMWSGFVKLWPPEPVELRHRTRAWKILLPYRYANHGQVF